MFKAISVYDAVMLKESWICTRSFFCQDCFRFKFVSVWYYTVVMNLGTWDYNVFLERTCFFTPMQCCQKISMPTCPTGPLTISFNGRNISSSLWHMLQIAWHCNASGHVIGRLKQRRWHHCSKCNVLGLFDT